MRQGNGLNFQLFNCRINRFLIAAFSVAAVIVLLVATQNVYRVAADSSPNDGDGMFRYFVPLLCGATMLCAGIHLFLSYYAFVGCPLGCAAARILIRTAGQTSLLPSAATDLTCFVVLALPELELVPIVILSTAASYFAPFQNKNGRCNKKKRKNRNMRQNQGDARAAYFAGCR